MKTETLATVAFVQTPNGVEVMVESDLAEEDVFGLMQAAIDAAEDVPDTPENRAAGSWGYRRDRRD